ncbi:hypothetical protein D3C75_735220 [compost metagenome]
MRGDQMVRDNTHRPGQQCLPVQAMHLCRQAAATDHVMVHQYHAEQRCKHRTDQQQEVLVLCQWRQQGDQRAQHANRQRQVLDLQAHQHTGGNGRRVNVGKSLFRLVQQNQQQWDAHAGAREGQQQGVGFATAGEGQGVAHAQAHQPGVADEVTQHRTAEYMFAVTGKTRVVGDQRQPGQRHGDGDVEAHGQRHRTVTGTVPQCRQVGLGEQVPGQPQASAQQQPDAPGAQHLAHERQRPTDREQRGQGAEAQGPEHRAVPGAGFAERPRAQQAGGIAHDDDLERAPAHQLQQVEQRRQARAVAAQAQFQRAHGRQAGIAADDTGSPQQQHTHTGAQGDSQHRAGKAQARGQHGADLQHHQADAEGEP